MSWLITLLLCALCGKFFKFDALTCRKQFLVHFWKIQDLRWGLFSPLTLSLAAQAKNQRLLILNCGLNRLPHRPFLPYLRLLLIIQLPLLFKLIRRILLGQPLQLHGHISIRTCRRIMLQRLMPSSLSSVLFNYEILLCMCHIFIIYVVVIAWDLPIPRLVGVHLSSCSVVHGFHGSLIWCRRMGLLSDSRGSLMSWNIWNIQRVAHELRRRLRYNLLRQIGGVGRLMVYLRVKLASVIHTVPSQTSMIHFHHWWVLIIAYGRLCRYCWQVCTPSWQSFRWFCCRY